MEISPLDLASLLLASFGFGLLLGVLHDIHRMVRVLCGVHYSEKRCQSFYSRSLPLIHRSLVIKETGTVRRGLLHAMIFLQDVVLFAVAGVGCVILHYEYNSGRFRFFSLVAMILGFLLYYFTVGKLVVWLSEGIAFLVRALFAIVVDCIRRPIVGLGRFLLKKLKKTEKVFRIFLAKRIKILYNKNRKKQLLRLAAKGFLNVKK